MLKSSLALMRRAPLTAKFGIIVVAFYVVIALIGPWVAPFGETEIVGDAFEPWGTRFLLGTDAVGQDMLSRLIYGIRNSAGIALLTTLLAFGIGSFLGISAALMGGWVDQVFSRIVDAFMAIPALIFKLLLLTIFGTSLLNLILIIAVIDSTRVFRLARAVSMDIVVMDYIEAAQLRGERLPYLVFREILPNAKSALIAEFGLRFCFVFLAISALSFLGLGIQPPTADLGTMVRENASLISFGDITPLLPALTIALLTVGVNFIVDWMLHRASGLKT